MPKACQSYFYNPKKRQNGRHKLPTFSLYINLDVNGRSEYHSCKAIVFLNINLEKSIYTFFQITKREVKKEIICSLLWK
ncbi:hypothetical protein HMPREF3218_0201155 [Prevotella bivia]|nr:hypothetical protein HMPREF3218_0201155 [Prevotella bivia]